MHVLAVLPLSQYADAYLCQVAGYDMCPERRTFCYAYLAEEPRVLSTNVQLDKNHDAGLVETDTRDRSCSNAALRAAYPTRRSAMVPFRSSLFLLPTQRQSMSPRHNLYK